MQFSSLVRSDAGSEEKAAITCDSHGCPIINMRFSVAGEGPKVSREGRH